MDSMELLKWLFEVTTSIILFGLFVFLAVCGPFLLLKLFFLQGSVGSLHLGSEARWEAGLGKFYQVSVVLEKLFVSCYTVNFEMFPVDELHEGIDPLAILESQVAN